MSRALSVHLPTWSVDLTRRRAGRRNGQTTMGSHAPSSADPPETAKNGVNGKASPSTEGGCSLLRDSTPILLIETIADRRLVARCCPNATASGIRTGMTLAHARALLNSDSINMQTYDPQRDEKALLTLAHWAMRFSPTVAPDPPDGLLLDITGCQRLFHGERRLINMLANSLEWFGFHARIASASTFACAWAAARFGLGDRNVIPPGGERDAISPLPVEALRIDEETAIALRQVGIDCIGHVLDLPRLELATRFGGDLLLRIDQAMGEALEVIEPLRPREVMCVERVFDGPVKQLEAVLITVRELTEQLAAQLQLQESGVRQLDLCMKRSDAPPVDNSITLSRPSRNVKHLWSLLRPKVENANLGFGVECITMTAAITDRLRHEQVENWSGGTGTNGVDRVGELIDNLAGRFGPDGVTRAELVESHVPERSFRHRSVAHNASTSEPSVQIVDAPRPSLLLVRPEPAQIISRSTDGFPRVLLWRNRSHEVIARFGPERIGVEWWNRQADINKHGERDGRDYFRIMDSAGRWLWMYRDIRTGQWFVHGLWA